MGGNNEISNIEKGINKIMKEQLKKSKIKYDIAEARIYDDVRTVGVKSDVRSYSYFVEITLKYKGKLVWKLKFLGRLSPRITNKLKKLIELHIVQHQKINLSKHILTIQKHFYKI